MGEGVKILKSDAKSKKELWRDSECEKAITEREKTRMEITNWNKNESKRRYETWNRHVEEEK